MVVTMDRHPPTNKPERSAAVRNARDRHVNEKARLDRIRLRSHRLIADKIDADRTLLEIPAQNLDRWRRVWGAELSAWAEWRELLKLPWKEIRALIVADTEESTRLRLSTPFVGVLSQQERRRLHEGRTARAHP